MSWFPSSGNTGTPMSATTSNKKEKPKLAPTIFYTSRTHTQITQVIQEYEKTSYRVPMAVLGSRKHYCTNPYLRGEDNVDEQCKLLLKNKENSCPEFTNVHKVKAHPSLQKGGCHEVHDIEDLVKIGQRVKGCSYFAACSMAQDAELVFCPYSYILNPIIREAMEVDISGSVIIFDEAHNMEDIARDAGSIDLEEEALLHLQTELEQLSFKDRRTYQPLFKMIQDILSWIGRRKHTLPKRESPRYQHCWTGDEASKELQEAYISLQSFSSLHECAKKAIKAASESESDVAQLSGKAANTLEGLFSSLNYFFSGNGVHTYGYELSLQQYVKEGEGAWTNTFSLKCLNPAIVFKSIADSSQSVILTSGTLSSSNTFFFELGLQFATCLKAPHVTDVDSQAAATTNGPANDPLNASLHHRLMNWITAGWSSEKATRVLNCTSTWLIVFSTSSFVGSLSTFVNTKLFINFTLKLGFWKFTGGYYLLGTYAILYGYQALVYAVTVKWIDGNGKPKNKFLKTLRFIGRGICSGGLPIISSYLGSYLKSYFAEASLYLLWVSMICLSAKFNIKNDWGLADAILSAVVAIQVENVEGQKITLEIAIPNGALFIMRYLFVWAWDIFVVHLKDLGRRGSNLLEQTDIEMDSSEQPDIEMDSSEQPLLGFKEVELMTIAR